jgi:hypothetical protein
LALVPRAAHLKARASAGRAAWIKQAQQRFSEKVDVLQHREKAGMLEQHANHILFAAIASARHPLNSTAQEYEQMKRT